MIAYGDGPSGETRTRGILVPKNCRNFFLIFSVRFWCFPLRIPCFPNLSSPLLPRVPNLSMVKNVVKTASHNLRQLFSQVWEAVSFRDYSLQRKIMQVIFFTNPQLVDTHKLHRCKQRRDDLEDGGCVKYAILM